MVLAARRLSSGRIDEGAAAAYNIPMASWLHGTLDVPALRGALSALGCAQSSSFFALAVVRNNFF